MRIAINPPSSLAHFQFITPLPQCSRAGAGFSWRDPMKGAAGEDEPGHHSPAFHTLFSWLPPRPAPAVRSPPPRGGSAGDIPGKAGRRKQPRLCPSPASPHTPDRGDITRGGVGEGTPSPSTKTIPALPQGPRAGSGAFVVMAREGRAREAGPKRCSHVPPPCPRAGAVQVISPERPARGSSPDYALPRHLPMHRAVGDITRGGAGEGTPSPSRRTILALPQGPRAGAGAFVERARKGRKPGEANTDTLSSPPPRPHGRGQCR